MPTTTRSSPADEDLDREEAVVEERISLNQQRLDAVAATPDFYIQVDETNTGGRALYRRCGFTDRYRYHCRLAPED